MKLLEFFYALAYRPLNFLDNETKMFYIPFFDLVLDIMKRPETSRYTRSYLHRSFSLLDTKLIYFLNTKSDKLSEEECLLLVGLLNLIKHIKRFLKETTVNNFPYAFADLTIDKFQELTEILTNGQFLKNPSYIALLQTSKYIEMAKETKSEAFSYLKSLSKQFSDSQKKDREKWFSFLTKHLNSKKH